MSSIVGLLGVFIGQIPLYAVWIAGIVIALMRRRKHPRTSRLTVIALAVILIMALLQALLNISIPRLISGNGWSTAQIGVLFSTIGVVSSLIHAAMWGLILWAIFGERGEQPVTFGTPGTPPTFGERRDQPPTFYNG